jgi:hypothetical protein
MINFFDAGHRAWVDQAQLRVISARLSWAEQGVEYEAFPDIRFRPCRGSDSWTVGQDMATFTT